MVFWLLQITREYRLLLSKTRFLNTALDPPEMEHELRLATYRHRARGQDDMSLYKLSQIVEYHRKILWTETTSQVPKTTALCGPGNSPDEQQRIHRVIPAPPNLTMRLGRFSLADLFPRRGMT